MQTLPTLSPAQTVRPSSEASLAAPVKPASAATPAEAPARLLEPSPRLRLDPALGLVVLEFHDSSGDIAHTIPNARQLAAYRTEVLPWSL